MATSGSQRENRQPRAFQYSLRGLFAFITVATVTFALLGWVAPHTGMGKMGPMFLLFIAAWVAFTVILSRTLARAAWVRALIANAVEVGGWSKLSPAVAFVAYAKISRTTLP